MIRKIYCDKCGADWKMHPEDVKEGWQGCVVRLVARKPDNLVMRLMNLDGTVAEQFTPAQLQCDLCGEFIPDGELAHAMSMWKEDPFDWESDYGTVIPEDAYILAKRLGRIRA